MQTKYWKSAQDVYIFSHPGNCPAESCCALQTLSRDGVFGSTQLCPVVPPRSHCGQLNGSFPIQWLELPPNSVLGLSGNPTAPNKPLVTKEPLVPGKTLLHLMLLFYLHWPTAVVVGLEAGVLGETGGTLSKRAVKHRSCRVGQDWVSLR